MEKIINEEYLEISSNGRAYSSTSTEYFFMTNVYTCLRGNKTCTKFEFDAPSLDEYLDVNVNDYYVEQDPFIASILMP